MIPAAHPYLCNPIYPDAAVKIMIDRFHMMSLDKIYQTQSKGKLLNDHLTVLSEAGGKLDSRPLSLSLSIYLSLSLSLSFSLSLSHSFSLSLSLFLSLSFFSLTLLFSLPISIFPFLFFSLSISLQALN
jgi:hypothetical protein